MKKILALILALCMIAAVLSGCGGAAEPVASAESAASVPEEAVSAEEPAPADAAAPAEETPDAEEAPASAAEEPAEEPIPEELPTLEYPIGDGSQELTMWYEGDDNESTNNAWLEGIGDTGVNVAISYAPRQSADDSFNLMVASGDYPDIVDNVTDRYPGGGQKAIDDEVVIDLADLLAECLPDYTNRMNADPEVAKDLVTDSGAYAAVYQIYDEVREPDAGPVIRKDWLEDLGLDIPETYDEYENVLLAFKDAYGISSPILMLSDGVPENNYLVAGHGIAGKTAEAGISYMPFYQVDGEVHYGLIEEGFREYTEMLHRWYDEGLFAVDYATLDNPGRDYLAATEQCGIWYSGSMVCGKGAEAGGMWVPDDPYYHVVAIPDAVKEKGDQNHLSTIAKYKTNHSMSITTDASDPELAAKWLNFWFTDKGSQLANYGVAGEGFDEASGGFSELILNNPDGLNYRDCLSQYTVTCVPYYNHVNRDMATYNSDVVEASAIWSSNRDDAYNYPGMATLDSDESAEFAQLYSDLGTVVSEQLPEFVMGVKDMSEWDGFVQTLKDMKIERCIELKQSALDRYLER